MIKETLASLSIIIAAGVAFTPVTVSADTSTSFLATQVSMFTVVDDSSTGTSGATDQMSNGSNDQSGQDSSSSSNNDQSSDSGMGSNGNTGTDSTGTDNSNSSTSSPSSDSNSSE